ncbi:hypothetical protein UT300019_26560 [Clostridium sp. CTA-19]
MVKIDKSALKAERVNPNFAANASLVIGAFSFTSFIISSCLGENSIVFALFQFKFFNAIPFSYKTKFYNFNV